MMKQALTLITAPSVEPVTLSEVKAHLRVETTADDALITSLISVARQAAETWLGRALITQTWRLQQDDAPESAGLELPKPPLLSVVHVKTYDEADVATVFAASNYFVDAARQPGRILLRSASSWPQVLRCANGFEVQFTAGYGAAGSDVPASIRQGLLVHIASLYTARGDAALDASSEIPAAVFALYAPYRLIRLGA